MVANIKSGTGDAPGDAPDTEIVKPQGIVDHATHEEESPLLSRPGSAEPKVKALTGVGTVIAVLLLGKVTTVQRLSAFSDSQCIGEFISNADATLVMAAAGHISSQFNRLRDASWLSTGYTLGLCAAQPMVGDIDGIFGDWC
jgi:hypothetical protein